VAVIVTWDPKPLKTMQYAQAVRFLHRAGARLTAVAKKNCPVDTGRLRASITWQVNVTATSMRYGSNVHYAVHQELGTEKMAGKHYLENALRSEKPSLMKEWVKKGEAPSPA